MSTKHKVIIVAFVVLVSLLLLIYFFGGKTHDIEKYENEDDGDYQDDFTNEEDDDDTHEEDHKEENFKAKKGKRSTQNKHKETNNKPKKASTEKYDDIDSKETSTTSTKKIDILKESMNYLNSMNLPFSVKKDAFTQLFNEKGFSMLEKFSTLEDIKGYVTSVVDKVTGKTTFVSKADKETPKTTKEHYEDFNDIKQQLTSLNKALAQISSTIEHFEKASETLNTIGNRDIPTPSAKAHRETNNSSSIEGFENGRFHYASIY